MIVREVAIILFDGSHAGIKIMLSYRPKSAHMPRLAVHESNFEKSGVWKLLQASQNLMVSSE